LPIGAGAAILVGQIAIAGPEWAELSLGIPAILIAYGAVVWRYGFREEDRRLFKRV
jgi:hypothetical protein